MAPGKGDQRAHVGANDTAFRDDGHDHEYDSDDDMSRAVTQEPVGQEPDPDFLARRSEQPQFTLRALLLGLAIGVLIAFSNTYFGLQTGWISGMAMPSALVGFAYFKGVRVLTGKLGDGFTRYGFGEDFSEVENVLVQTVAGSVGTMPLGCGFVGVVPALEFLLKRSETPQSGSNDPDIVAALVMSAETGGLKLPLGKLVLWALGICFFGVVFAVPLRKEVIVREKLKFPSGTATALMIGVLHGGEKQKGTKTEEQEDEEEGRALIDGSHRDSQDGGHSNAQDEAVKRDWKKQIRLLTFSFSISGVYVSPCGRHLTIIMEAMLTPLPDSHVILRPSAPQHSFRWVLPRKQLAMVTEPLASVRRPGYHYGTGYHHPHATWRNSWLGSALASSQIPRLGKWRC
jgi:hypothetical protein